MGVLLARCGLGCAVGATIFYLEEDQTWYQSTIIGAVLLPAVCHANPQQIALLQRGTSAVLLFFLDKQSSSLHLFRNVAKDSRFH
jgi:hypothetical protein